MDARNNQDTRFSYRNGSAINDSVIVQSNNKVMHRRILNTSQSAPELHGGILEIFRREVLPQKTRTVRLVGIKSAAVIIQTLLGYEVQARHKRIHCPDLVTARYLKLFSELGCRLIRLPYDPTVTARLIPTLEMSHQRIKDTVAEIFPDESKRRQYVIQKIYTIVRNELREVS